LNTIITETAETVPNILPGWTRLPGMGSIFHLGRYKDGFEALVGGSRGIWAWRVERRQSLTLRGEVIATGETNTQRKAKLAAQKAITAARRAMARATEDIVNRALDQEG